MFTDEEIVTSSEYQSSGREQIEILEEQESLKCIEADDIYEQEDLNSRPVILIVEDNVDLLNYIARNLEEGYRLMTASNGMSHGRLLIVRILWHSCAIPMSIGLSQ